MPRPDLSPTSVAISIGGGVSLSITQTNDLIVEDGFIRFSLGRATKKRFADLRRYLDSLAVHAEE